MFNPSPPLIHRLVKEHQGGGRQSPDGGPGEDVFFLKKIFQKTVRKKGGLELGLSETSPLKFF